MLRALSRRPDFPPDDRPEALTLRHEYVAHD
jgi:hypothetical protein